MRCCSTVWWLRQRGKHTRGLDLQRHIIAATTISSHRGARPVAAAQFRCCSHTMRAGLRRSLLTVGEAMHADAGRGARGCHAGGARQVRRALRQGQANGRLGSTPGPRGSFFTKAGLPVRAGRRSRHEIRPSSRHQHQFIGQGNARTCIPHPPSLQARPGDYGLPPGQGCHSWSGVASGGQRNSRREDPMRGSSAARRSPRHAAQALFGRTSPWTRCCASPAAAPTRRCWRSASSWR